MGKEITNKFKGKGGIIDRYYSDNSFKKSVLDLARIEYIHELISVSKGEVDMKLSNDTLELVKDIIKIIDEVLEEEIENKSEKKLKNVIQSVSKKFKCKENREIKIWLEAISSKIEIIILRYQKNKKSKEVLRDHLTGLLNRKGLIVEIKNSIKTLEKSSIIMVDIDYFKQLNDKYGHNIGDECLEEISKIFMNKFISNEGNYIGRWGGEEFIILLSNTNGDKACEIAEELKKEVQVNLYKNLKPSLEIELPKITISLGVTEIKQNEEYHESINRADKALYIAKNKGRNIVEKI